MKPEEMRHVCVAILDVNLNKLRGASDLPVQGEAATLEQEMKKEFEMQKSGKKGFFGSHAKSSAMVVSLIVHAILIAIAVSFVAVQVIIKDDNQFEARKVSRPKMPLKRLQVPVKVQKKPKPKLRKQIMVKKQIDRKMPDIKMPDIAGIKGGIGSIGAGADVGIGSVGFSLPEINVFGVKSKSEKVFFILNGGAPMMSDKMGGILAYSLIKEELIRIVENLPPTVLFNVAVFQDRADQSRVLFPSLVNASRKNVEAMEAWLGPLNAVSAGMSGKDFGTKTLGPGGSPVETIQVEPIESYGSWLGSSLLSMKQQADSVYLLTSGWGSLHHRTNTGEGTGADNQKKQELYEKAKKMLAEENALRRANGQPPRILTGKKTLIKAYFPGESVSKGKESDSFYYTPEIVKDAMDTVREEYAPVIPTKSGLTGNRTGQYTFNVIHFVPESDDSSNGKEPEKLKKMARMCRGKYRSISGLEAIQGYIQQEQDQKKKTEKNKRKK